MAGLDAAALFWFKRRAVDDAVAAARAVGPGPPAGVAERRRHGAAVAAGSAFSGGMLLVLRGCARAVRCFLRELLRSGRLRGFFLGLFFFFFFFADARTRVLVGRLVRLCTCLIVVRRPTARLL